MANSDAAVMSASSAPKELRPGARLLCGLAWAGVALIGAWFRVVDLAAAPLSPREVVEALSALLGPRASAGATSGLLLGANHILYWLFGSGDGISRLLPALVGSAVPLLMWLFRHRLGAGGALGAAGLLAISPSLVLASRTASGTMPGVAAALFLWGALEQFQAGADRRWLMAGGVALGLGIASGAGFYTMAPVLGAALYLSQTAQFRRLAHSLGDRGLLLAAAVSLLLGCIAFLFLPAGLGVMADGLVTWLEGFGFRHGSVLWPLEVLLVYEPLAVLLGVLGALGTLRRRHGALLVLVYASALGIIVSVFRSGQPDAPLLGLVPLALLGGACLSSFAEGLVAASRRGFRGALPVTAAAIGVLGIHLVISLGQYARHVPASPDAANVSLLLVGVSAILTGGVVSLAWTYDRRLALQSLMLAWVALLALFGWGKAWELGKTYQGDPRELWVDEATAPGAHLLVDALMTASERSHGTPYDIAVTVQADDPALRWLLRDFANVTWVRVLPPATDSAAVVTLAGQESPALGESYSGMDVALRLAAPAVANDAQRGAAWLRWFLLRDAPLPLQTGQVILWLRQDLALTGLDSLTQ